MWLEHDVPRSGLGVSESPQLASGGGEVWAHAAQIGPRSGWHLSRTQWDMDTEVLFPKLHLRWLVSKGGLTQKRELWLSRVATAGSASPLGSHVLTWRPALPP